MRTPKILLLLTGLILGELNLSAQAISGPRVSTNSSIATFDRTDGKGVASSAVNIATNGNLYFRGAGTIIVKAMTTAERDSMSPTNGMLIYNSTTASVQRYQNDAWGDFATPTPAGSNTQVQFNDAGTFGSDPSFLWDKSNDKLSIQSGDGGGVTIQSLNDNNVIAVTSDNGISTVHIGWRSGATSVFSIEEIVPANGEMFLKLGFTAVRLETVAGDPTGVVDGQFWYNSSTGKFRKRENGITSDLDTGGAGVTDGDKGDITVSGGGATWNVDSGAINFNELAGTADDAQIPNNITLTDFSNATHTHQSAAQGGALDAAAVTSGIFNAARLGSGTPDDNGILRGDGTWQRSTTGGQVFRLDSAGAVAGWGALDLADPDAITGDIPDFNLSANVPLLNTVNNFTASSNLFSRINLSGTQPRLQLEDVGADANARKWQIYPDSSENLNFSQVTDTEGAGVVWLQPHDNGISVEVTANGTWWKFSTPLLVNSNLQLVSNISPPQITADQNNYNPSGLVGVTRLRISTDASRNITGLVGQQDGQRLTLHNIGTNNVVLVDESASSIATNRFALDGNLTLTGDSSCELEYDLTSGRWRIPGVTTLTMLESGGVNIITSTEIDSMSKLEGIVGVNIIESSEFTATGLGAGTNNAQIALSKLKLTGPLQHQTTWLSGATPTVDLSVADRFSQILTTNTTYTFSSVPTGTNVDYDSWQLSLTNSSTTLARTIDLGAVARPETQRPFTSLAATNTATIWLKWTRGELLYHYITVQTAPVPVADGGTGTNTLNSGEVLIGNGTAPVTTRGITGTGLIVAKDTPQLNAANPTNYLDFSEIAAPATPATNTVRVYGKDVSGNTKLFIKDDSGNETQLGSGGASLPTQDNSTIGAKLTSDGTNAFWAHSGNELDVWEEWLRPIEYAGVFALRFTGTGDLGLVDSTATTPGLIQSRIPAANDTAEARTKEKVLAFGGGFMLYEALITLDSVPTGAQDAQHVIGFADLKDGVWAGTNGCYFIGSSTNANWVMVSSSNGVSKSTATSLALDTTPRWFRITMAAAGNNVTFYSATNYSQMVTNDITGSHPDTNICVAPFAAGDFSKKTAGSGTDRRIMHDVQHLYWKATNSR